MRVVRLLIGITYFFLSSCAHSKSLNKSLELTQQNVNFSVIDQTGTKKTILKPEWYELFTNKLFSTKHDTAVGLGLFSYGGWSDNGQRFIIISEENKFELFYGTPNSTKIDQHEILSKGDLKEFINLFWAFKELDNYDSGAFDGIQYEFIQAEKKDGVIFIKKRVFMNNPGLTPEGKKHAELIETYLALEKKALTKASAP